MDSEGSGAVRGRGHEAVRACAARSEPKKAMTKETAQELLEKLQACIRAMNDAVSISMNTCTAEEAKALRRGLGYVMSEMQDQLIDPICREHPDLIPAEANYAPPKGPTLAMLGSKTRANE